MELTAELVFVIPIYGLYKILTSQIFKPRSLYLWVNQLYEIFNVTHRDIPESGG